MGVEIETQLDHLSRMCTNAGPDNVIDRMLELYKYANDHIEYIKSMPYLQSMVVIVILKWAGKSKSYAHHDKYKELITEMNIFMEATTMSE